MLLIRLVPELVFYLRLYLHNPDAFDVEFLTFMGSIWIFVLPIEIVIGVVVAAIIAFLRSALLKYLV